MDSINHKTTPRAKKTKDSIRRPIVLSPQEYADIQGFAEKENRSVQNFMRVIFFQGLAAYKIKRTTA